MNLHAFPVLQVLLINFTPWYDKLHILTPENPVCKRYIFKTKLRRAKLQPGKIRQVSHKSFLCFLNLKHHTCQCKRTGGCHNALSSAFFPTGAGENGIPTVIIFFVEDSIIVRFVLHPGIDQMKAK